MRNWDSGTETGATRTAGLGHAELGQRDWDMRNWDSATGTRDSGTFFVIRVYKMVEILRWYAIIAATNTVESSR